MAIELDKEEEIEYIPIIEKCTNEKSVGLLSYSHFLLDYRDDDKYIVKNPDENIMVFLTTIK